MADIQAIANQLSELTVMQMAELSRLLEEKWGVSAAALAHRWALAVPGVATVVLGVKNRVELAECVAAAATPLSEEDRLDIAEGARV